MKSKQSRTLKGRNLKNHIRKLYQERLSSNSMFLENSIREDSRVKILSRKTQEQNKSELTSFNSFVERQKEKFLAQQGQLIAQTKLGSDLQTGSLIIRKINKAVDGSRFNIFNRPKFI